MRITNKDLEIRIQRINEMANFGKGKELILTGAYGGVDARIVDRLNGYTESHVFHHGYTTKKELYISLCAMKNTLEMLNNGKLKKRRKCK
jgi:hypothetical protein